MEQTIAAISTPHGSGGIAVIRLSGPQAFHIANKVWRGADLKKAESHTAHLGEIVNPLGEVIDQGVATVFHAGRSFTGEDTVEFSTHGSPWIQRETVNLLISAGASAAEPGEFTRRAFMNGRIDLAQAEGIADVIAASSKAAANIAARQLKGDFSRRFNKLRNAMIDMASMLELELDFSEEDVEFANRQQLLELCKNTKTEVDKLADSFYTGRALKEGVAVIIAGVPNAGKSTLLNHLLEEEKAIVSDISGTTRDIIEDTVEINGILFRFIDTAGLRPAENEIERIGIERAQKRAANADIILWINDITRPAESQKAALQKLLEDIGKPTQIVVINNKCDIATKNAVEKEAMDITVKDNSEAGATDISTKNYTEAAIDISAKNGEGIDMLITRLTEIINKGHNPAEDILLTNARHYDLLKKTSEALANTIFGLETSQYTDLIAQDLREAIHHLSEITGTITSDTLLHTIFSRFCIGK